MKILIIEDDKDIAETLRRGLTSESHTVELVDSGADGSFMGRTFEYDAIILDYSLPKKNGLIVCKEIRAAGKLTPIIFLSVVEESDTKVAAFDEGADDYMTKPFSLQELYARLKLLSRKPKRSPSPILRVHDLSMDTDKNIVMRGDRRVKITHKEYGVLQYLLKNAGTVVSRALLMEHVWSADSNPFSNTVEAHMRNLRKKINAGRKPNLIVNIPGRGYVIDTPANLKNTYDL